MTGEYKWGGVGYKCIHHSISFAIYVFMKKKNTFGRPSKVIYVENRSDCYSCIFFFGLDIFRTFESKKEGIWTKTCQTEIIRIIVFNVISVDVEYTMYAKYLFFFYLSFVQSRRLDWTVMALAAVASSTFFCCYYLLFSLSNAEKTSLIIFFYFCSLLSDLFLSQNEAYINKKKKQHSLRPFNSVPKKGRTQCKYASRR